MKAKTMESINNEVEKALAWFGIDASPYDCDYCDDGSVYYGLTKII